MVADGSIMFSFPCGQAEEMDNSSVLNSWVSSSGIPVGLEKLLELVDFKFR